MQTEIQQINKFGCNFEALRSNIALYGKSLYGKL